jgi:hypothetical protein
MLIGDPQNRRPNWSRCLDRDRLGFYGEAFGITLVSRAGESSWLRGSAAPREA